MTAGPTDPLGELTLHGAAGERRVRLADYLDEAAEEAAAAAAHEWIKGLRGLSVDGQPLRRRFQVRGDSLWWFTELYLHKQQVILQLHRAVAALERLVAAERPTEMRLIGSARLLRVAGPAVARAHGIRWRGPEGVAHPRLRLARIGLRARALRLAARASRLRPGRGVTAGKAGGRIAGFVHTAFWRHGGTAGGAESYIGPVLDALDAAVPADLCLVGVGPAANFRARRWWHPLQRPAAAASIVAVESFAGLGALAASEDVWRRRGDWRRALWDSAAIRQHAVIGGADCWPIVREEIAGVVELQWTWSARAMDEAAAALDALRPAVVLTYAEAGGWGRALLLECRRRGIPSAGLQHGFIHRHWLNYRHEADEMEPDPGGPGDRGFPRPDLTLLFDDFTRQHLEVHGRFPPTALAVTGSPRLDALVGAADRLTADDIVRARSAAGAAGDARLVLLVTKHREAAGVLDALAAAVAAMPDVQLAIKAHPAETADAYAAVAARASNIRVLPPDAPLAPLIRASRAVVTVNSTVAIDAAVLGVPALVVGLPNNLSPFVAAGLMSGVPPGAPIGPALGRILYDEGFRVQLEGDRAGCLARFGIGSDGRAAVRSAAAVRALAKDPAGR